MDATEIARDITVVLVNRSDLGSLKDWQTLAESVGDVYRTVLKAVCKAMDEANKTTKD